MSGSWMDDIVTQARNAVPNGDIYDDFTPSPALAPYANSFVETVPGSIMSTLPYKYHQILPEELVKIGHMGWDFATDPNNLHYTYGLCTFFIVLIVLLMVYIFKRCKSVFSVQKVVVVDNRGQFTLFRLVRAFLIVACKIFCNAVRQFVISARLILLQRDIGIIKKFIYIIALFFRSLVNLWKDYYTLIREAKREIENRHIMKCVNKNIAPL